MTAAHPYAQCAASAVVFSCEFLAVYASASLEGRARLLDAASPPGPASWHTRVPSSSRFRFFEASDAHLARCADLLVLPPHLCRRHCRSCARAGRESLLPDSGRHHVSCPAGWRVHSYVHDPVRDALADLCAHARVSVIAERPGSHRQMSDFMAAEGRDLLKQPDIVLGLTLTAPIPSRSLT